MTSWGVRIPTFAQAAGAQVTFNGMIGFSKARNKEAMEIPKIPLEALAAGMPAVLLDTPVAHESCGNAALYVQKGDVTAAAAALTTLLFDEDARRPLRAAAGTALARFDWARAARETLVLLEEAS